MAKEIQMNPQMNQPRVDLRNTTMVQSEDGNVIFTEGFILRKVSKILTGTNEDALIPIPIIVDYKTGKPLFDMIPMEIREEYKEWFKDNE